jgi:uncharacterized protein HemX
MPTPPATDEHSLSAATPIAAGAAWAVGGVLLVLTATAAVAHYRVGKSEEKQAATEVRVDAGQATLADHETRLRLEEEDRRQMRRLLEKMDGKMDRLLEGGTRTAGGRK